MSKFITFEGIDGSGKSTQARLLADYLSARGTGVFLTKEPGEGKLGEAIRAEILDRRDISIDPYAELCLFCADRAQHVRELILPKLRRRMHGHLRQVLRFDPGLTRAREGSLIPTWSAAWRWALEPGGRARRHVFLSIPG